MYYLCCVFGCASLTNDGRIVEVRAKAWTVTHMVLLSSQEVSAPFCPASFPCVKTLPIYGPTMMRHWCRDLVEGVVVGITCRVYHPSSGDSNHLCLGKSEPPSS